MVVALLEEISSGAAVVQGSPAMPLLAEYLTQAPVLSEPSNIGGNLITLRFSYLFDDMLRAVGVSRASILASICYTLTTFMPNVAGIEVYIDDERVEHVMLGSISGILFDGGIEQRADYAALLMDDCTLYFADAAEQKLVAVERPLPFYQTSNPARAAQRAVRWAFSGGQRAGRAGHDSGGNAERFRYYRNLSGWGYAAD